MSQYEYRVLKGYQLLKILRKDEVQDEAGK